MVIRRFFRAAALSLASAGVVACALVAPASAKASQVADASQTASITASSQLMGSWKRWRDTSYYEHLEDCQRDGNEYTERFGWDQYKCRHKRNRGWELWYKE